MSEIEQLDYLINYILNKYDSINSDWEKSILYKSLNMKKNKVNDLYENSELSDIVFNYRNFINDYYSEIYNDISSLNIDNEIEMRIKTNNSLQDKIVRYCNQEKHEYGHIPINKCVNDLIGFRIIFNNDIDLIKIIDYINSKYNNIICRDSSKNGYIATHIYFVSDNNYRFRWELQLWNKSAYINNKECHEIYKQAYTKYEFESKEEE